jgi:tripartite-type tricarboxylate transporter receptor subunit TctC
MKQPISAIIFGVAVTLTAAVPARAAGPNLSGKAIRVVVSYAAGGPVDIFGRLVARHLSAHVPGKPNVIVENMPGAAGVVAANYIYNVAPKDGTAILVTIAPFTTQYIGGRPVKFDSPKFYWLGAFNISQGTYANKILGVKTAADLLTTKTQVVIGGLGPNSSRDLRMRAFLDALGVAKYKYVSGYPGTLPARQALIKGEVNFSDESVVALAVDMASLVKDGTVVPLVQTGLTRAGKLVPDPRVPKMPIAEDEVVRLKGPGVRKSVAYRALVMVTQMAAMGRAAMLPPGVDPATAGALRKAFAALNTDADFIKDSIKVMGGERVELIDGEDAQKFAEQIAGLVKSDKEANAYLNAKAKKKGGG